MKIAMVDPAAFTLPYDTALCDALARAGHDVTLFTTRFAHGTMPVATEYTLSEWFYARRIPGLPRRVARGMQHPLDMRRLGRHLRRENFDLVHVQWSVIDSFDVRFWEHVPLPVVFTAHNSVGRAEALQCEQLQTFDAVVAHSEYGARGLREQCNLRNVWHVPHGAFDSLLNAGEPPIPPIDLDDGPVVSLTGLLRPYKGIDTLLEAWPRVLESAPTAQLVIAGRPMGVTLPEKLPARTHVLPRFLDEDEFAWILRRTQIVCLPYRAIDLSGVLFSALALGKPLVLSDVGGFSELQGQGADLVRGDDPHALGSRLGELLGQPEKLASLAQEASIAARERYSWDAIAQSYSQHYADLVGAASSTEATSQFQTPQA